MNKFRVIRAYLANKIASFGDSHITEFASLAHEDWRRGFDSDYAQTGIPTKERIKKNNSDGTEGNIHVPFDQLHPDWQRENLAAGSAAKEAIARHTDIESQASFVHGEWMKRNPKGDWNAHQHVPYQHLPEDEKEKDRDQVRTMQRIMDSGRH